SPLCTTTPPQLYPLSLHDALPICPGAAGHLEPHLVTAAHVVFLVVGPGAGAYEVDRVPLGLEERPDGPARAVVVQLDRDRLRPQDRKSTRLNSSHVAISYAVFCLK